MAAIGSHFFAPRSLYSSMLRNRVYILHFNSHKISKKYSNGKEQEVKVTENSGVFAKLKVVVKAFTNGSKLLIKDVREMREISRRLKGFLPLTSDKLKGLSEGSLQAPVSSKEFMFVMNTRRDLKGVLPALVLFWIPCLGYFAPVIAFMFPQYLLSSHFLTEAQKDDIMQKSLTTRSEKLNELSKVVGSKLEKASDLDGIIHICQSELVLSKLSRSHLILLRDVWGLSTWIPTILPRRKLEREIMNIFIADLLMKSEESVVNMPEDDVNELCLSRCMFGSKTDEENKALLKKWIDSTSSLAAMDSKVAISSVVCHLPLFMKS